jgi:hypothetical protein
MEGVAMAHPEDAALSRRRFVIGAAGTVAGAGLTKLAWPSSTLAASSHATATAVLPPPSPVPGGIELAPSLVIHVFAPGDPSITLPFTGGTLQGFDVEPITATDFKGSSAVAFHVGSARGSDGKTYNLETDIRAFEGQYVVDGVTHRGAFAFV